MVPKSRPKVALSVPKRRGFLVCVDSKVKSKSPSNYDRPVSICLTMFNIVLAVGQQADQVQDPIKFKIRSLGATLGAPGRPGEPLWTLWGGTLGALARPGDSSWHSSAQRKKRSTKREPNSRSPGRIVLRLGSMLRCFFAYFAKNRSFFK